jgi:pimeloyl-ACP methyl ester carboxylesterase
VQPRIAARTCACLYDRAGYGFSDPSPRAADANNAVDDLHALLQAAAIAPPYVLVGNSFGGASAQLFAWRFPAEVAGLVLIEPMHEDENVPGPTAQRRQQGDRGGEPGAVGRRRAFIEQRRTARRGRRRP